MTTIYFRATQVVNGRGETYTQDGWCRTGSPDGPTAKINRFIETDRGLQAMIDVLEKGACGQHPHLQEKGSYQILGAEDIFLEPEKPIWGWCPDCETMGHFDYREK